MAATLQLHWEHEQPKKARPAKISPDSWAKHEAIIRELYESQTLTDLIATMKNSYGFTATRRQYIYQLGEHWGLYKYDTKKSSCAKDQSQSSAENTLHKDNPVTRRIVEADDFAKRRRSIQSVGSQQSGSSSVRPSTKKKAKILPENESPKPKVILASEDEEPGAGLQQPTPERSESSYHPTTASTGLTIVEDEDFENRTNQETCQNSTTALTPLSSVRELEGGESADSPATEHDDLPAPHRCRTGTLEILRKVRKFRQKGTQNLLKGYDQKDLREAADYLYVLAFKAEAFEIYAFLLESEKASIERPLSPLLISCARSAQSLTQCVLVQESVLKRLRCSRGNSIGPPELFLIHMLLAQSYALLDGGASTSSHLEEARISARNFGEGSDDSYDTSLDTLVYILYKDYFSPNPETNDYTIMPSMSYKDFLDFIVKLRYSGKPSPSLLGPSFSGNLISIYMRSCFGWCRTSLALASSGEPKFPGSWRTMNAASEWSEVRRAETVALFQHLWGKWHAPAWTKPDDWPWIIDSHDKVGISAAELLSICCELINRITPWKPSLTDANLLKRFEDGLREFHALSDQDLVTRFLQLFYEQTVKVREGHESYATRSLSRLSATIRDAYPESIRSRLSICSVSVSNASTQYKGPTLARSYPSSNSSYQRFVGAGESFRQYTHAEVRSGDGLEPSAFRQPWAVSSSQLSDQMSQLSDQMTRSLSLNRSNRDDASQRTRFSTVSTIATTSTITEEDEYDEY